MAIYYDCLSIYLSVFPLNSESLEYAYTLTPSKVLSTKDPLSPGEYLFGVGVWSTPCSTGGQSMCKPRVGIQVPLVVDPLSTRNYLLPYSANTS